MTLVQLLHLLVVSVSLPNEFLNEGITLQDLRFDIGDLDGNIMIGKCAPAEIAKYSTINVLLMKYSSPHRSLAKNAWLGKATWGELRITRQSVFESETSTE